MTDPIIIVGVLAIIIALFFAHAAEKSLLAFGGSLESPNVSLRIIVGEDKQIEKDTDQK